MLTSIFHINSSILLYHSLYNNLILFHLFHLQYIFTFIFTFSLIFYLKKYGSRKYKHKKYNTIGTKGWRAIQNVWNNVPLPVPA